MFRVSRLRNVHSNIFRRVKAVNYHAEDGCYGYIPKEAIRFQGLYVLYSDNDKLSQIVMIEKHNSKNCIFSNKSFHLMITFWY